MRVKKFSIAQHYFAVSLKPLNAVSLKPHMANKMQRCSQIQFVDFHTFKMILHLLVSITDLLSACGATQVFVKELSALSGKKSGIKRTRTLLQN